jgi:hypothetical protein
MAAAALDVVDGSSGELLDTADLCRQASLHVHRCGRDDCFVGALAK